MKLHRVLTIAIVLAVGSVTARSAVLTAANIDSRDTLYALSFADSSFAGAFTARSDNLHFHGNVGDSGTFGIVGFTPGNTSVSFTPASGMAVSNVQPANAALTILYTASIVGASQQSLTQSWINVSTLTSGVTAGGLDFLDFNAANSGFLRSGGQFDFKVVIPGHWSTFGTSSGDVQFLGINPAFTIVQNFAYDAVAGSTTFEALDSSYALGATTDVHFVLFGATAAVPEPATWILMLAGSLPMLGWAQRRRRAVGASL
jgi:hypothetical protein